MKIISKHRFMQTLRGTTLYKTILLGLFAILVHTVADAQSLQDIATIKVDQLSDQQLMQLISRAQAAGLSEQQLITMARQRGMPASEVAKFQQRASQLGVSMGDSDEASSSAELRSLSNQDGEDLFESASSRDSSARSLTQLEKKIFGYAVFHNKNLNFSPNFNMATPQNYVVGPNDQLIIQIYGVSQENYSLTVSPEGKINIPNIGLIHVGGFTIDAVTSRLKQELSKRFSGLRGSQPNTFLSVTIGNIRTIKVNIVGELKNPGTYTLPSFASVFNALYAAGGPTTRGTFRNVQVYRSGKLVSEVDIYQFLTRGQETGNLMLEDNDVILVRPIENRVELVGEVRVPGLFEVKRGESLADVLYYAGGFTQDAYEQLISVRRNTETQKKVETVLSGNFTSFQPEDGDVFLIGKITDLYSNRVQISGAVIRQGEFELNEGMTIKDLIEKAGGLRGDAFMERATLYRTAPDFTLQAQSINVGEALEGGAANLPLQNEDIINIPSRYDVREEYYIEISGEVNRTGIFPYAENLTVGDLLLRAGGFKEAASNSSIEIARRVRNDASGKVAEIITISVPKNLELSPEDDAVKLEPFDHVFVRRSPGYREQKLVTIEGEVNYPGTYALESTTMRISDLVKRAGNLNAQAYPKGATLLRRNEFYQEPSSDEIVMQSLQNLRQNTQREMLDNPASEKLLLERIDRKLTDREKELAKQIAAGQAAIPVELRQQLLPATDTSAEVKDKELVGINLDMILANPGSKYDLILQPGDVITVPRELQTVRLRGQVLYPTTTRFDNARGFKGYINSAGGFTERASKKRSYVIYANGDVRRTRSFLGIKNYPGVEPGAEIVVPLAPPRQGFNIQQVGAITSVLTGLATFYLLLDREFLSN